MRNVTGNAFQQSFQRQRRVRRAQPMVRAAPAVGFQRQADLHIEVLGGPTRQFSVALQPSYLVSMRYTLHPPA